MIRALQILGVLLLVATALFWEPTAGVILAAGSGIVVFESQEPWLIAKAANAIFLIDDGGQSVSFESISVTQSGAVHIVMDPAQATPTMEIEVAPEEGNNFFVSITR